MNNASYPRGKYDFLRFPRVTLAESTVFSNEKKMESDVMKLSDDSDDVVG